MSYPAFVQGYYTNRAIDALGSSSFAWDNIEDVPTSLWRQRNSKCSHRFTTTATSIVVESCGNMSAYPTQGGIDVYRNGVLVQTIAPGVDNTVYRTTVALAGGAQTIEVYDSAQYGGTAPWHGHFVRSVFVPIGSTMVPMAPVAPTNLLDTWGDSILDGFSVEPQSQGSIGLLRTTFPGRITCTTRGNRSLYGDTSAGTDTETIAQELAGGLRNHTANGKCALLGQLTFNDYYGTVGAGFGVGWRANFEFKATAGAVLDRVHVLVPEAAIFYQTATITTLESTANGNGDTPQSFRDAIVSLATTRSWMTIIPGLPLIVVGDLVDFTHPGVVGQAKIRTGIETSIRGYFGY